MVLISPLEMREARRMQDLPDHELMELIRRGDEPALLVLIRRHQSALLNFFCRLGVSIHDAEDLVQETLVRVFRYRHKYVPSAKFTTFLYRIARHAWIDRWRQAQRRLRLVEAVAAESESEDSRSAGRMGTRLDAQAALAHLPGKLRIVIVLSVYQGMAYEEIAATLRIPVGTVKSRVFLAMNRLREVMRDE